MLSSAEGGMPHTTYSQLADCRAWPARSIRSTRQVRIKGKGQSTLSAAEGGMGEEFDDQMQIFFITLEPRAD